MKGNGKKIENIERSEAVSELIGVILMVSLVIVGIAMVGVFITGQGTPTEIPSLSMIPDTNETDLFLYHDGGDSLGSGEFFVRVDGVDYYPDEITLIGQDGEMDDNWDSWDLGETLYIPDKSDYNQILLISTKGGQGSLIASSGEGTVITSVLAAEFSAAPRSGDAPLYVSFTDLSTGSPTSWSWNFGDGGTSTAQDPDHTYTAGGTYTVTLTVSNADGSDSETKSGYITVSSVTPSPPVANFTADPTNGSAPLTVSFTDLSTGSPTSWLWDFGDGTNSTGQNPVHVYSEFGTYTVSLTVTNADGSDTETKTAYISVLATLTCENSGLTGYYYRNTNFEGTPVVDVSQRLRFADDYGASYYGYESDIPNWPYPIIGRTEYFSVMYEGYFLVDTEDDYTFNLTSDDGSRLWIDDMTTPLIDNWDDHPPESSSAPVHLTEGYHPIKVMMYEVEEVAVLYLKWSSSGSPDVDYMENFCLDDYCTVPVAEFEADVTEGSAPLTVNFTDLSSGCADSWLWDFGDGETSTDQNPGHVYTSSGVYNVSLRVSDGSTSDYENKTGYITVTGFPQPAAWWTFDESSGNIAVDSSGNNNDGTIYGSYSRNTGACGNSLYFDGETTYISVPASSTLDAPSQVTLCAWIYPEYPINKSGNDWQYTNYVSIIDKGEDDNDNYEFFVRKTDTVSRLTFESDNQYDFNGLPYEYNQWQHLACVIDSDTATGTVYIDGSNVGTFTVSSSLTTNNQPVYIGMQKISGGYPDWATFNFKGQLDDVRLYTTALSGDQISDIYSTCTPPSPVAEFSADVTSGDAPLTVTFSDLSTGAPTSWYWDFGDGDTSTEQNPVHEYTSGGTYTVSLRATNAYGSDTEEKTDYIDVTVHRSDIDLNTDRPFYFTSGSELEFDVTGYNSRLYFGYSYISLPVGTNVRIVLLSDQDGSIDMRSSGTINTLNFDDVNLYIDGVLYGSEGSVSGVWISGYSNMSSTLSIVVPYPGYSVQTYLEVDDVEILPYWPVETPEVHINNMYPDSDNIFQLSSATEVTCSADSYELIEPLIAEFTVSPSSGYRYYTTFYFTDDSEGTPTSWEWDFDDGQTSTEQNPMHVYTSSGWKDVTLTVSNANGSDSITKKHSIRVY